MSGAAHELEPSPPRAAVDRGGRLGGSQYCVTKALQSLRSAAGSPRPASRPRSRSRRPRFPGAARTALLAPSAPISQRLRTVTGSAAGLGVRHEANGVPSRPAPGRERSIRGERRPRRGDRQVLQHASRSGWWKPLVLAHRTRQAGSSRWLAGARPRRCGTGSRRVAAGGLEQVRVAGHEARGLEDPERFVVDGAGPWQRVGRGRRSTTETWRPAWPRKMAVSRPTGPPPTTRQSTSAGARRAFGAVMVIGRRTGTDERRGAPDLVRWSPAGQHDALAWVISPACCQAAATSSNEKGWSGDLEVTGGERGPEPAQCLALSRTAGCAVRRTRRRRVACRGGTRPVPPRSGLRGCRH